MFRAWVLAMTEGRRIFWGGPALLGRFPKLMAGALMKNRAEESRAHCAAHHLAGATYA
jgi:hypothetical protein